MCWGAILARHHDRHRQIVRRGVRAGRGLGSNMVMYQECAVARRYCFFSHLEILASRRGGPVVEGIRHVVCTPPSWLSSQWSQCAHCIS